MRNPQESVEWRDAFHAVLQVAGQDRVRELMDMLSALARDPAIGWQPASVPTAQQAQNWHQTGIRLAPAYFAKQKSQQALTCWLSCFLAPRPGLEPGTYGLTVLEEFGQNQRLRL